MCNNRRHFGHKAKCCKGKLLITLLWTKFAMLRRRSLLLVPGNDPLPIDNCSRTQLGNWPCALPAFIASPSNRSASRDSVVV
jgi:hypothetical protein